MPNEQPNPPHEGHDQDPQGQLPPDPAAQASAASGAPLYPDSPVVEAADFLGLDAELSQMAQRSVQRGGPAPGGPPLPADSASSWFFQTSDSGALLAPGERPPGPPGQAPEHAPLNLQPPPQYVPGPPQADPFASRPQPQRPGASWLLDPERRAAASAAHQINQDDGAWLLERDEFAAPRPGLDPNLELAEGSYFEPEPAGRALGRLAVRGIAAGLLIMGGVGAWRAMSVAPSSTENPEPLVLQQETPRPRGNERLEPLEGPQPSQNRTARSGASEPSELQSGSRTPAVRNGGREARRPSVLGTVRRDHPGPIAGSVRERKFVFVPDEVAEARGVLANLNALSRGEQPLALASADPVDWEAEREATRALPVLQGRWLGPLWSSELALAQRALEVGVPAVFESLDPHSEFLALGEVSDATQPDATWAIAALDETPPVPSFEPALVGALAALAGVPFASEPGAVEAFDLSRIAFPPSSIPSGGRLVAAEVVGSTGRPFAPGQLAQAEAGPGMVPLVGVGSDSLMGPALPFGRGPNAASLSPTGPPVVTTPGASTAPRANPLAGFGWPGSSSNLPELSPSNLRYAQPSDLWLRTTIPLDKVEASERLRTPRVGLVRVLSASGEVFQGRLFAVGQGQVWLDTSLGRMSLAQEQLQRIERIEGDGTGELNGAPGTNGLERVRVRAAGGYFVGYQLSRKDGRVVLLTDDGNKLSLRSDEVEPDGPRRVALLRRDDGGQRD